MIDFKLAKELKDNGFPQNYKSGEIYFEDKSSEEIFDLINNHDSDDEVTISVPTISELIESCGDGFYALNRNSFQKHGQDRVKWTAVGGIWKENIRLALRGENADEVMAKLWLELKKVTKNKA